MPEVYPIPTLPPTGLDFQNLEFVPETEKDDNMLIYLQMVHRSAVIVGGRYVLNLMHRRREISLRPRSFWCHLWAIFFFDSIWCTMTNFLRPTVSFLNLWAHNPCSLASRGCSCPYWPGRLRWQCCPFERKYVIDVCSKWQYVVHTFPQKVLVSSQMCCHP